MPSTLPQNCQPSFIRIEVKIPLILIFNSLLSITYYIIFLSITHHSHFHSLTVVIAKQNRFNPQQILIPLKFKISQHFKFTSHNQLAKHPAIVKTSINDKSEFVLIPPSTAQPIQPQIVNQHGQHHIFRLTIHQIYAQQYKKIAHDH